MDQLPYIVLMIFSSLVSVFSAVRVLRSRRKVTRANSFAMMAICAAVWMLLTTLALIIPYLTWKEVLWALIPFAILTSLTGLFFFSLEFSLRLRKVPKAVLLPTVTLVMVIAALSATNPLHHLAWKIVVVNGNLVLDQGIVYQVQMAFAYLFGIASMILLIRAFMRSTGVLRRQTALLLIGILIPMVVSVATDGFGWDPLPYFDETAFSIVFTVILFGWTTLQFKTFYLLPVASDVIIKSLQEGILVTDVEGLIFFSNPAAKQFLGKTDARLNGLPVAQVLADWLPEAYQAWDAGKEDVQLILGQEEAQYFRFTISRLADDAGETIGSVLKLYDNTDQKKYELRLNELAICDPLTGCYNRRYFFEIALAYYNQTLRSHKPLSLMMLDIDQFKQFNDTFGHVKGDYVLQSVVALCKSLVRAQDIFSRYGGEEFILAMPDTTLQQALLVAERLRGAIEGLKDGLEGIPVTASFGVVETTGNAEMTLDILVNRVDQALYSSKHAGRNRVTAWKGD